MLQQLVLTHAGQTQTLAGIISVKGKPGQKGKWELDACLNGSMWRQYLTLTAYARPGNTGAVSCVFVKDEERSHNPSHKPTWAETVLKRSTRGPKAIPKRGQSTSRPKTAHTLSTAETAFGLAPDLD
ncbi:hypothetical protein CLOM_g13376 [Closterium sp. NIES-68]|nr:hypothetical protein CLOM_g23150 [Closterium sp. NIES-68]GJP54266.1 hypothetical protein CLOM_g13376 [Closterium sp. NIES-68]GJP66412.1 hypothetical protein CLOP_g23351 [Closterium sp. NIES-67]GJP80697.1 hypothetical protein CLOP_g10898 [Closterium sp. NIES-67]